MIEKILVTPALLESLVAAGRQLVNGLERNGFPLTAAFWMLDPSEQSWRLLLAADGVLADGLFKAYGKVLDKAPPMAGVYWPSLIRVEDSTRQLIKSVRHAVRSLYAKEHTGPATVQLKSTSLELVSLYVYKV
jgi:hypothetical protein